jgi:hypothetical protein
MSEPNGGPPRRDKFAALASAQQPTAAPAVAAPAAAAPKRDKFAALASRSEAAAPKRDKFAALANRSATGADATTASTVAAATAPKRDKFAALGQRAETKASSSSPQEDEETARKNRTALSEQRKKQRAHVWQDLDDAQDLVLDLLEHARQTAITLAEHTTTKAQDDGDATSLVTTTRHLAALTRETLASLHGKLAPHADLVKAYQEPQRVNRMYQARIEEGLARQKKELLTSMVALERQANQTTAVVDSTENVDDGESRKRKLDQV